MRIPNFRISYWFTVHGMWSLFTGNFFWWYIHTSFWPRFIFLIFFPIPGFMNFSRQIFLHHFNISWHNFQNKRLSEQLIQLYAGDWTFLRMERKRTRVIKPIFRIKRKNLSSMEQVTLFLSDLPRGLGAPVLYTCLNGHAAGHRHVHSSPRNRDDHDLSFD